MLHIILSYKILYSGLSLQTVYTLYTQIKNVLMVAGKPHLSKNNFTQPLVQTIFNYGLPEGLNFPWQTV